MSTSEDDIRKGVVALLEEYGALDTSEIKKKLGYVLPFDKDDIKMSKTRNEMLIMQRIGNIVSHQKLDFDTYLDTYAIDKSFTPAKWFLLDGLKTNETLKPLTEKKIKSKKAGKRKLKPRKADWNKINDRKSIIGKLGEEFVVSEETKRVMEFAPNDLSRIIHFSEKIGDGAGYDIISVERNGNSRLIEVKTTTQGCNTPFYMSKNEYDFFKRNKDNENLYIYRVYNFDENSCQGKIKRIKASSLLTEYKFETEDYKVTKK